MKYAFMFLLVAALSFALSALAYVMYRLHRGLVFLPVLFFIWRSVAFFTRNIPEMDSFLFLLLRAVPIIVITLTISFLAILAYFKFPDESAWD